MCPPIKGAISKFRPVPAPEAASEALSKMGPLTVITGILLGSCLSIAFSLGAVVLMVLAVGTDDPRLTHEFPALLSSLLIFSVMTAISALSFYLLIRRHPARWLAQVLMWAGFALTGFIYWQ